MYKMISDVMAGARVYGIEGYGQRAEALSTNRFAVKKLTDRCNLGELASCQLFDVAEDFLVEISL